MKNQENKSTTNDLNTEIVQYEAPGFEVVDMTACVGRTSKGSGYYTLSD